MTSFKASNSIPDDVCEKCGGGMNPRPLAPYPVKLQIIFGVSFLAFLLTYDSLTEHKSLLWIWSGIQVILGLFLIQGRRKASRRVLRCARCGTELS
ncbi:MAG: hypothetical protein CL678_18740 [Bdellovibrionaceae bacterium]|nr:hypothetical protein [Pseudobdellovibrionaceae bacterium]|tara:strand:+ start:2527 stop:2814 length:288 start_codon:yes stop_codon:yes gene_type:complete